MSVSRNLPDEELINSLKTGYERNEAIRFIYSSYFDVLSRYVISNQGTMEDAEDIFQEVVINFIALVQMDKFRGESSIKTFLFSMNRFNWLNELKKRGKSLAREIKFEQERDLVETDVSLQIVQKESADQVKKLVEELGETCKKILVMFYYEALSMRDILEQLNYENEQVVRNKKYKCLKQLEKMISDNPALKHTLKNLLNG